MLFPWEDRSKETMFLIFIQSFWNNWQETTCTMLLDNNLALLLPFLNGIRLDLD